MTIKDNIKPASHWYANTSVNPANKFIKEIIQDERKVLAVYILT